MRQLLLPIFLLISSNVFAQNITYPSPLLLLDDFFSHHIIIAEKSTHQLHLYKNNNGSGELVKSYQMATGKVAGNKIFQGDHRTPEGIYQITDFITNKQLLQRYGKEGLIYGVGAFVLNYPNPIDSNLKKTGSGIWLHSTNDETRIDKGLDSRGCVVIANKDLKEVSEYIELNKSMIVIVQNLNFLQEKTWNTNKKELQDTFDSWLSAWRAKNIEDYIKFYDQQEYKDKTRGNYQQFKNYKKSVFSLPGAPEINATNLTILNTDEYAIIVFKQDYKSFNINDIGKKTLYLKKNDRYEWKIVAEIWSSLGEDKFSSSPFKPSMRFFNTPTNSDVILTNK